MGFEQLDFDALINLFARLEEFFTRLRILTRAADIRRLIEELSVRDERAIEYV